MANSNNLVNIDFNKLIDENNDTVIKIFDYIKLHKWKELKKQENILSLSQERNNR